MSEQCAPRRGVTPALKAQQEVIGTVVEIMKARFDTSPELLADAAFASSHGPHTHYRRARYSGSQRLARLTLPRATLTGYPPGIASGPGLRGVAASRIQRPILLLPVPPNREHGGLTWGAFAMTAGVFLPAFAFSMIFYDRLERVLENRRLHAVLDGVAAGVVGLIAATTVDLMLVTAGRVPSLLAAGSIFAAALAFLYVWKNKLNVAVVILAAGVAGWLLFHNRV